MHNINMYVYTYIDAYTFVYVYTCNMPIYQCI